MTISYEQTLEMKIITSGMTSLKKVSETAKLLREETGKSTKCDQLITDRTNVSCTS